MFFVFFLSDGIPFCGSLGHSGRNRRWRLFFDRIVIVAQYDRDFIYEFIYLQKLFNLSFPGCFSMVGYAQRDRWADI